MSLAAGTRLGPYEVTAQIGVGGMGEVYQATDTKLKRLVAIKVLPEAVAADTDRLARFQREAEVLASLNHPHIAAIYGLEDAGGAKALVMELVEGEDLAERLTRGAIPVDEAIAIAKQIAEALEEAHEHGIIHRDLKPANVKVREDGTVKVLDFGLAKALEPAGTSSSPDLSQSPTLASPAMSQAGIILGTAAYMSPEQARGKVVDRRADVWAFGVELYEMLTGGRAFPGEDMTDTLAAVVRSEPSWDALPAALSPTLRVYLLRCLHKDPKQRLGDIRNMRLALEGAFDVTSPQAVESVGAEETPWRRTRSWALPALVAVTSGIAVWNLKPTPPQPALPVSRTVVALQADETILPNALGPLTLSPDGSLMVYAAQVGNDPVRLYLRRMDSLEHTALSGTDGADSPFLSPDGQWLGFFAGRELKKVPITGGTALTICSTADRGMGARWGPDDHIIFGSVGGSGLLRVSAEGGTPEPLTSRDAGSQGVWQGWPEILPGGQEVLFATATGSDSDVAIVAQRLDTGERKVLMQGGSTPRYASTGHLVYNQAGTVMAVPLDLDRLEVSGSPVPVVEGVRSPSDALRAGHFAISRTGTLAYIAGSAEESMSRLVWVDRQGVAEPLSAPPRSYEFPRVSPDGQWVAAGIAEDETHVWVYEILRTRLTRQTFGPGNNTVPQWSHDGKRFAFVSTREGPPLSIFWQLADGGGGLERLTTSDYQTSPASFSPDGQLLAFIEDHPEAGRAIRVMRLEGREVETFLQSGYEETAPKFSPDGNWMVYTSTESGRREVYVQPYPGPGGKWQISSDGGQEPVWNPQGGELFYRSGNRIMAVAVETDDGFAAGTPRMLFAGPYQPTDASFPWYDVSPDGQRFLMLEPVGSQAGGTQIVVVQNWVEELKRLVPTN